MEKRFILFIVVSFLILAGWQFVMDKFYPKPKLPQQKVTQQQIPAPQPSTEPVAAPAEPVAPSTQTTARTITVDTPLWRAVFDNRGGVLRSYSLKALPNGREILNGDYKTLELVSEEGLKRVGAPLRLAVDQNPDLTKKINSSLFEVEAVGDSIVIPNGSQQEVTFRFQDTSGLSVRKTFRFYGGKYIFDTAISASQNGKPLDTSILIGPNFGDQSVKTVDTYINTPQQVIVEHDAGKVEFITGSALEHRGAAPDASKEFTSNISWIGAADHYFAMTIIPPKDLQKASLHNDFYKETVDGDEVYRHLLSVALPIVGDEPYTVFIGPKDRNILADLSLNFKGRVDMESLIDYGIFSFLVRPLIPLLDILLRVFYNMTHNYGWAIILLTFLINMLFFPLKWKSSVAMKKAMKMQPKMKELQEQMKKLKKDDPRMQEIQMEQMKLMREGNPLSGCLPLLLQMPIFWAFFIFLSISIDVRHSAFIFWIKDLAAPDKTWILPIIMTLSMMASTFMTPTPNDPAQKMQKYLTSFVMPVIFLIFFFANAPSGLVLYWMFGNIIGIAQQLIINKMTQEAEPPDAPETKPAGKSNGKKERNKTGDLANAR